MFFSVKLMSLQNLSVWRNLHTYKQWGNKYFLEQKSWWNIRCVVSNEGRPWRNGDYKVGWGDYKVSPDRWKKFPLFPLLKINACYSKQILLHWSGAEKWLKWPVGIFPIIIRGRLLWAVFAKEICFHLLLADEFVFTGLAGTKLPMKAFPLHSNEVE